MAPHRFLCSGRRALQIGCLLIICVPIAFIYYVYELSKGILYIPGQLWFCSVGFELTPSYATSAFSCEAGSDPEINGPILFLDGNEAYKHTMSHLSNDSNYQVGTKEISNIASMLSRQVAASMERTQSYINGATLSYPDLPGLTANNTGTNIMRQAFAKIETTGGVSYEQVLSTLEGANGDLYSAYAILVGYGLGLY